MTIVSAGCITLIVIETKLDAFAALSHLVFHRVQSPVSLNIHFVKTHTRFIEASGIDGFHGACFTSGGVRVGVCIRCNCVQIQAGKCYIESLLLVPKDRRSCFSESEGSTPLYSNLFIICFFLRMLSWHLETIIFSFSQRLMSHGVMHQQSVCMDSEP